MGDPYSDLFAYITAPQSPTPNDANDRRSVYRNNYFYAQGETLRVLYPVVCKLVGDNFFKVMAREYINARPPAPVSNRFNHKVDVLTPELMSQIYPDALGAAMECDQSDLPRRAEAGREQ